MKNINKLLILLTLTFINDRSVSMENTKIGSFYTEDGARELASQKQAI
jgi:hypothetical protein